MSKVYVKTDSKGRIIACEGGYSIENIKDFSEWVLIDEGEGDRYNHCQGNYFGTPLFDESGVPVYKIVDGVPMSRTAEEIAADVAALPPAPKSMSERVAELEKELAMPLLGYVVDEQGNKYKKVIEGGVEELRLVESYDGTCRY